MIRTITLALCWFFVVPAHAAPVDSAALLTALADLNGMDDTIHALIAECPTPTYHSRNGD